MTKMQDTLNSPMTNNKTANGELGSAPVVRPKPISKTVTASPDMGGRLM